MSTLQITPTTQVPARPSSGLTAWWTETRVFALRNLEHIRQVPEKLTNVTIQPLMLVLLFA
jgi:ABC-2 type transport system permease protein